MARRDARRHLPTNARALFHEAAAKTGRYWPIIALVMRVKGVHNRVPFIADDVMSTALWRMVAVTICVVVPNVARAQRAPLIRPPIFDSVTQGNRERKSAGDKWYSFLVSNDPNWCTGNLAANAIRFCPFFSDPDSAHKAARYYWDNADPSIGLGQNLNAVGNGRTQSTYLELLSDYWNTIRVSFAGVYTAKPSDSTSTVAEKAQSKAAQFLNGGGPAIFGLVRPLAVASLVGARTQLLASAHSAFSLPASGASATDSLKYVEVALETQTSIGGADNKIGGDVSVHLGRAFGGHEFYHAVGTSGSFGDSYFNIGLTLENSVRVSWTKLVLGPSQLRANSDFLSVNITRFPNTLRKADTAPTEKH